MVKLLQQYDCSIHVRDRAGSNLLHIAVTRMMTPERENSFKDIIEWLLNNGCDPLTRDNAELTPNDRGKEEDAPSWALESLKDRVSQCTHPRHMLKIDCLVAESGVG